MLKLLERTVASLDERLVLLAPSDSVPAFFTNVDSDARRHRRFVREMQKLRGQIYCEDGALGREQLTRDGLHATVEDEKSWHLLTVNPRGKVTGCVWFMEHVMPIRAVDLRVRHTPLARMADWRGKLWRSVEAELARAREDRLNYAEVGGWAVSEDSRCTSEGLLLALAGYSLGRISGGCLGITTATVRHCSSSILRRLGGSPLDINGTAIPKYFDPRYQCDMEILRFDSRKPNPKYNALIEQLRYKMASVSVIALPRSFRSLEPCAYEPIEALAS